MKNGVGLLILSFLFIGQMLKGQAPVSNFSIQSSPPIGPNVTFFFTDQSTNGPIAGWLWDFGDGGNSTAQNPIHTYPLGIYTVCLTVFNQANEADSSCQTIRLQPPVFSKSFTPSMVPAGQVSTLRFVIDNTSIFATSANISFTDNLPAGLTVAPTPNVSTNCIGGSLTAMPGSNVISYSGGSVPPNSICEVSVDVVPSAMGTYVNTTGDLTSDLGNSGPAAATLQATQPIPTMGEWALLITMLMIGILGVTMLTNRRIKGKLSN